MYALHIGNNMSKVFLRWKFTMPITLQHKDEISLSVNVAKAEKSNWIAYAAIKALCFHNVLSAINK